MEINQASSFKEKAVHSCESLFLFSAFVNEIEYLDMQEPDLFPTHDMRHMFREKWFQIEIFNACVLSEWEEMGSPKEYTEEWNNKYRADAVSLIRDLLGTIFRGNE